MKRLRGQSSDSDSMYDDAPNSPMPRRGGILSPMAERSDELPQPQNQRWASHKPPNERLQSIKLTEMQRRQLAKAESTIRHMEEESSDLTEDTPVDFDSDSEEEDGWKKWREGETRQEYDYRIQKQKEIFRI